ncbi:SigE family RNA polymerase sigma factor [Promicromonospora panici]|uniref:SigE family RNA polymerase sigma factor n=1 Tax=Promicromonospora panici TaxID=2219658 RepID=UPI001F5C4FF2|nr:SigE family RNA polymerase sigma factor [Promicromonospora panici]
MTSEGGTIMDGIGTGDPATDGDDHGVQVEVLRTHDEEFTEFVRDAAPYLHRTAYLLSGDVLQAEELVQATFERVYRAWHKARDGSPRAYARRILVNLRIDGWRRRRRETFPGDDELQLPPTSDHASHIELRDELVRALARLSATQRRVVVLRHLLDLTEAQVARELGLPLGTVKAANSRGLARLRDLFREAAEAIEPVTPDEEGVLEASRRALRRRRTAQGVGAVGAAVLLALGVLTRGPVPLPIVGDVVLPGGQLILPLFEAFGWADSQPTPTAVACPAKQPAPPPVRVVIQGEELVPTRTPLEVDLADARALTCHDVTVEAIVNGSADDGSALLDPSGLTETGDVWGPVLGPDGTDGLVTAAYVDPGAFGPAAAGPAARTTTIRQEAALPELLTVRNDHAAWIEVAQDGAEPAVETDLSSVIYLRAGRAGDVPFTVMMLNGTTPQSTPQAIALTRDTVMWLTGEPGDQNLYTAVVTSPYDPGYAGGISDSEAAADLRDDLGPGWTAIGGSDDEAVAAHLEPGRNGLSTTTIRGFDGNVEWDVDNGVAYDTTGTDLVSFEHDESLFVSDVTISPELVAWVLAPADGAAADSLLYVRDRRNGSDSQVRIPDGLVSSLTASDGVLTWNVDRGSAPGAYLYRATPSASGYPGPDLARIPGTAMSVGLAGSRVAWREQSGNHQWLSVGTVAPTPDLD